MQGKEAHEAMVAQLEARQQQYHDKQAAHDPTKQQLTAKQETSKGLRQQLTAEQAATKGLQQQLTDREKTIRALQRFAPRYLEDRLDRLCPDGWHDRKREPLHLGHKSRTRGLID
jgi:uncharacterized protein YPO0396